jgi:hypothetical protein
MAIIVCLVAIIVSSPVGVEADEVSQRDNLHRDAGGPLDVSVVSHGHRGERLVHTLHTYDSWRGRWLRGRANSIQLTFDRQDGEEHSVERVLAVDYMQGRLIARMLNVTGDRSRLVGYAKIERPRRTVLTLVFPRRFLKRVEFPSYRWGVNVFYNGPGCDSYCGDDLPSSGRRGILHEF